MAALASEWQGLVANVVSLVALIHASNPRHGGTVMGGSVVERLPLAQVMILGSWDRVLHLGPCREPASPLPMSLPLFLCLS